MVNRMSVFTKNGSEMIVKTSVRLLAIMVASALLTPIITQSANATTAKSISAQKAATNIVSGLNKVVTAQTTAEDTKAKVAVLASKMTGVTVTPQPFFRNIVFFDVVASDGFRCIASKSVKGKPSYKVINSNCQTYADSVGSEIDKAVLIYLKAYVRSKFITYTVTNKPTDKGFYFPEYVQNYGATITDPNYVVTNTPDGISVAYSDRTNVVASISADSKGKIKYLPK